MSERIDGQRKVSGGMQRYAAGIFRLEQDNERVSLAMLADEMDASHQAIARMVKRLTDGGYADFEPYKGVRLTARGQKIAMPSLRRHRLGEVFLVNVMGYDWAEAHRLADQFELGMNAEIEDRIDELTDYPKHCPHGEPIPDKAGNIVFPQDQPLIHQEVEGRYRLSRVRTHSFDKLRYLDKLDMKPGIEFTLVTKAPFRGPLRLRFNANDRIVGYELASSFWVERVKTD